MTSFSYRALGRDGKPVQGHIDAPSLSDAAAVLRGRGEAPISVKPMVAERRLARGKLGQQEIAHFTNQLAALLAARLPMAKALENLEKQAPQESLRLMVTDLGNRVREGQSLSEALSAYPRHFDDLYRAMVRAGEIGGALDAALLRLAEMQEKDAALRARIKGALTYPLIMLSVMVISVIVLVTFVVPRFTGVFTDMGAALPWPTQLLITVSAVFRQTWWLLALMIGALVGAARYALRSPRSRLQWDRFKLGLPVFGSLLREIAIARFSTTLSSLLGTGVPMLSALDATRDVSGNLYFGSALAAVRREVQEGRTLSAALADRPKLSPALMVGLVATGEETGNLPDMLASVGRYYTKESDARVQILTTLMEPLIILLMGVMVGFIIISMLLPIFEMTSLVK